MILSFRSKFSSVVLFSLFILLFLSISACEKAELFACQEIQGYSQEEFNALDAEEKLRAVMAEHRKSQKDFFPSIDFWSSLQTSTIVDTYFTKTDELKQGREAAQATAKFLLPDLSRKIQRWGAATLIHTLINRCDAFAEEKVKKVHAIASFTKGHMVLLENVMRVREDGTVDDSSQVKNPYTGIWGVQPEGRRVPLVARFSIANPVIPTHSHYEKLGAIVLGAANKARESLDEKFLGHDLSQEIESLDLEFIPGLGLKFFVDGEKSLDLVAMDSLAGQFDDYGRPDHNYFKYEFSHDFSKHAPMAYNTAKGGEYSLIYNRYKQNPANHLVMTIVGKRFEESMESVGYKVLDPHSLESPSPFIMSISPHAAVDVSGNRVGAHDIRRPWRIVFRPALRSWDSQFKKQVPLQDLQDYRRGYYKTLVSPLPLNSEDRMRTDVRGKLSYLPPNTIAYDVLSENKEGQRYLIGYIVVDETPTPSEWADKNLFIKHDIETERYDSEFRDTIVDPR